MYISVQMHETHYIQTTMENCLAHQAYNNIQTTLQLHYRTVLLSITVNFYQLVTHSMNTVACCLCKNLLALLLHNNKKL